MSMRGAGIQNSARPFPRSCQGPTAMPPSSGVTRPPQKAPRVKFAPGWKWPEQSPEVTSKRHTRAQTHSEHAASTGAEQARQRPPSVTAQVRAASHSVRQRPSIHDAYPFCAGAHSCPGPGSRPASRPASFAPASVEGPSTGVKHWQPLNTRPARFDSREAPVSGPSGPISSALANCVRAAGSPDVAEVPMNNKALLATDWSAPRVAIHW